MAHPLSLESPTLPTRSSNLFGKSMALDVIILDEGEGVLRQLEGDQQLDKEVLLPYLLHAARWRPVSGKGVSWMALIFRSEDKRPSPDLGAGAVDSPAELTKEEKYRRAAESIQIWMDVDDDGDLVVLEEMRTHLRVNPIEFQK